MPSTEVDDERAAYQNRPTNLNKRGVKPAQQHFCRRPLCDSFCLSWIGSGTGLDESRYYDQARPRIEPRINIHRALISKFVSPSDDNQNGFWSSGKHWADRTSACSWLLALDDERNLKPEEHGSPAHAGSAPDHYGRQPFPRISPHRSKRTSCLRLICCAACRASHANELLKPLVSLQATDA